MASRSMASAALGFVLTPSVSTNTGSASRTNMVFFSSKNSAKSTSKLVVRAAEEGAAPPAATAAPEAPKPKPPPIGPKRGTKVTIILLSFSNHA
uniref:Photosystem I reaction center subunit IV Aic n=1 Tax=Rhizophora mucronata TaxID=61149 RepID=A0A2P2K8G0_RHIMU